MNTNSINFKLITRGLLAVLVPLAVTGYMSIRSSSQALTELSQATAKDGAISVANLISKVMAGEKQSAQVLANDELVKKTTETVNKNGIAASASEIALLRQQMKEDYKIFRDKYLGIFVTDANGLLYTGELASGKEYKGSDISTRGYFQQVKNSGQPVIGDIVRSKSTGKLISVVCAPILTQNGSFQGVIGMSMNASVLSELVTAKKIGSTGYAFMANKEGIINAHPVAKYILELDLKTLKGMEDITRAMMAGETGVKPYHFKGIDKIAGFAPVAETGWSVALTQDQQEFLQSIYSQRNITIMIAVASLLIIGILIMIVARGITRPINNAVLGLKDIAQGEGDLTMRLPVTSKDEIGELATWFNSFIEKLQEIIGQLSDNAKNVDSSSGNLNNIAQQLKTNADDSSARAESVAAAAEEMNVNMSNVAAAMEQSTINTSMVASAAEEMTATITEIAKNAEDAHAISESAVHQANATSEKMAELGQAAQAISKVTETITEISEQTNLLALNATIEAARAGEAGKGFAVVANEIKELAKQTAEATMDIKNQIEGVQGTTNATVQDIEEISKVINSINEIVGTISAAVVQQSSATQEIADNISQASTGLGEVNENVNQSSAVSSTITQDIVEVNTSVSSIAGSSEELSSQAGKLKNLAESLTEIIGKFKV